MNLLVLTLRFVGRLILAVSDEIDRAVTDYHVEVVVPDTVPDWVDDGSAL